MSLTVVFRQTALRNLARIRSEDKDLFGQTRHAIALLADQPYPKNAVAWGATGVYRLHSGGIRVLFEVDERGSNGVHHQHRGHPLNPRTAQWDGGNPCCGGSPACRSCRA